MDLIKETMHNNRLTLSAENGHVRLMKNSVLIYLSGQNDWKWVMAVIRQSGLQKREALNVLLPMKGQGWRFRSEALFNWLEH